MKKEESVDEVGEFGLLDYLISVWFLWESGVDTTEDEDWIKQWKLNWEFISEAFLQVFVLDIEYVDYELLNLE